jgi:hypothetical protein
MPTYIWRMKLDSVRGYRIRCSKFLRYIILQGVLASPGAGRVPHAVWLKLSSKSVLLAISVRPMYILLRKLFYQLDIIVALDTRITCNLSENNAEVLCRLAQILYRIRIDMQAGQKL